MSKKKTIALVGNPNSGKTSLFNQLTGLRQKVGNFPGVTVERKLANIHLEQIGDVKLIDLPGTYSLYPTSMEENVVLDTLLNNHHEEKPNLVVYVLDSSNLENHFLLLSQLCDLQLNLILALNMSDVLQGKGKAIDVDKLSKFLNIPIVKINGRTGEGTDTLKELMVNQIDNPIFSNTFYELNSQEKKIIQAVESVFENENEYQKLLIVQHSKHLSFLSGDKKIIIEKFVNEFDFKRIEAQLEEIMKRFQTFSFNLKSFINHHKSPETSLSDRLDRWLTHPIIGPFVFFFLMLFTFQAIFSWATIPMDWIDESFAFFAGFLSEMLPDSVLTNLLIEGIIPGLSGIAMFVPQIFILFLIISMFEEIGYMSRAVYLFDGIMQRFGMNGRSIVTLISGGACAVPAIMSTRIISNWKERLITIMVTPLISCSARIPVFAILVAFLIPSYKVLYVFNSQGLVFMGLYLLGILSALISAIVFKKILKSEEASYLMIEMPDYKMPDWKNVFFNVWNKVKSFVLVAGKVIFFISIVLWFLASYGGNFNDEKVKKYQAEAQQIGLDEEAVDTYVNSKKLEYSYAGQMGKLIEPAIEPLGFDWKIGIALITSFAAREVFVGTMSTLYSIGNDNPQTIREKLKNVVNPKTGKPMFTFAVALSLLLFYVFALQCMSTLAVVYKETKSWKWPIIQFIYMGAMAYFTSLIAYQLFK